MIEIRLTPADLMAVGWVASGRRFNAENRNALHHGNNPRTFESEFVGVKGEIAFRRMTGLPWSEESSPFETDFPGYEIKCRNVTFGRDLFIKHKHAQNDAPSTIYVLAWTLFDHSLVQFVGWDILDDIVNHPKLREVNGDLCLPYRELRPMEEIPCLTRC